MVLFFYTKNYRSQKERPMIAVVVKCGKNDYMVIDDREWSSFNNSIKSLSGSDKKNRTYQIGDRNFTYKETKKFKH